MPVELDADVLAADADLVDAGRSAVTVPRSGRRVAPIAAVGAALVAGILVFMLATANGRQASASTPLLDQPAPGVAGTLADGSRFELSRRKGSWVVLNFFDPACVPCIAEHPELIRFVDQQRALGTSGAEFFTIVQNGSRDEVARFFAERGGDWPVVYDDGSEFQIGFGVAQVPETWIIDPSGFVRGRIISTVTADDLNGVLEQMRSPLP
ncbi:MAG TPA: TlpA disulfide reductase family protein [Ilumatobacter sp.]|nr:TlpA disulfide reductase family protein [Ilumatobacter sp.]